MGVTDTLFINNWNQMSKYINAWAERKGFWEDKENRNNGEILALIHSEISEALEGLRHGNPSDDKIPHFNSAEAELADTVIRIMDLSYARGWRVGAAIVAKMDYNEKREYKHGKQF